MSFYKFKLPLIEIRDNLYQQNNVTGELLYFDYRYNQTFNQELSQIESDERFINMTRDFQQQVFNSS